MRHPITTKPANDATVDDFNFEANDAYKQIINKASGVQYFLNPIDTKLIENDNQPMNTPSREEFNAKIEAVEARMDTRVSSIEGKIDGLMTRMEERDKRFDERTLSIQSDITTMKRDMVENSRSLKYWLIGTGIATVIGLFGANITMVQTMFGAFESGKSQATAITQATEQIKQTQEQLKAIEDRLAKQTTEFK
ncbi:hypothetical protein UFOVP140_24 [uncultured Caudovirales phage]|uniref:Uncharacterized protein n=1 Tax=uncultured Caudovirales phage TaxID=2100421 RepID=A0A6J5LJ70_9CAUD|nr:hypothetical protein UFOVP140_24 [uncultured Caudovirales phage]